MGTQGAVIETPTYNYRVVRQFAIMTVVWGIVGMGIGVWIAAQLAWPALNFDLPWTSFGRLRPLHTNGAIFAFVGNMMFAGVYYSTQRLCKARLASDVLSWTHFWGWQLIIVAAAILGGCKYGYRGGGDGWFEPGPGPGHHHHDPYCD